MARKRPTIKNYAPTLVLSGPEDRLSLVLAQDGDILAAQELAVQGSAMQHLAPAVDAMLERLSVTTADLTGIACVRGPGGFTGIRMVLAHALGIARGAGIPLAGLDYLPLIAAGPAPLMDGPLAVITYSRTKQVYLQVFETPDLSPMTDPMPLSIEEAAATLRSLEVEDGQSLAMLGSGLRKNMDFFASELPGAWILDARFDHPMPAVLARAAASVQYSDSPIAPMYLRASDAEDNLAQIAAGRGIAPEEAQARLAQATSHVTAPDCAE